MSVFSLVLANHPSSGLLGNQAARQIYFARHDQKVSSKDFDI